MAAVARRVYRRADAAHHLLIGPVDVVTVMPDAPKSLREVVLDVLEDRGIPVIGNVNLGHAGPNIPLPLGVRAAIDADARTIELLEGAVSQPVGTVAISRPSEGGARARRG